MLKGKGAHRREVVLRELEHECEEPQERVEDALVHLALERFDLGLERPQEVKLFRPFVRE